MIFSGLLEDFKKKSYSVKEMEILFENWRRKVEIPDLPPPTQKPGKTTSLLRMFSKPKEPPAAVHPPPPNTIQTTTTTKKFTKDGESAVEVLNESEMSAVVCLPPTPLKPAAEPTGGCSSQILPLHRFSSETSLPREPPPAYKEPPRPKPVAEVSPFSSKKVGKLDSLHFTE